MIWYVTRLKDNAIYEARKEFDIPDDADSGVLKDEEIILYYGDSKKEEHRARRIAYWDDENERLFEFISNNFKLSAEKIALKEDDCAGILIKFCIKYNCILNMQFLSFVRQQAYTIHSFIASAILRSLLSLGTLFCPPNLPMLFI